MVEAKVEKVFALFDIHGKAKFMGDDELTELSHMVQTAMSAEESGEEPAVVLGALLHDIGNLVALEKGLEQVKINDIAVGPKDHGAVGEEFLKSNGFPQDIYSYCKGHVQALRYLAVKDPNFKRRMRQMSYHVLSRNGGPMNPKEVQEFEKIPNYRELVLCRRWEENVRDADTKLDSLDKYKQMAVILLKNRKC